MSEWISAKEAREIVAPGWKHGSPATDPIRHRAKNGVIKTMASVYVSTWSGQSTTMHSHPIPKEFWGGHPFQENWTTGDFSVGIHVDGRYTECEALGVTFERTGIEALAPPSVSAGNPSQLASSDINGPASTSKNPGGRPSYDWEAVMIELAGQIHEGALIPDSQASIEKAIQDFFIARGQEIGDTTARDHARPLYRRLTGRGGN